MKYSLSIFAAATLASAAVPIGADAPNGLSRRATTLPAVTVSGNAFYADKKRFFIRGIDYQPGGSSANIDPLADKSICTRDIKEFKKLGINTVRVYTVDNTADHDTCMQALADAGIYLVLDVNTPAYSINRAEPALSYNAAYLQNVFATVEAFAKYTNVLAFFSGNEVINDEGGTTRSAPYVKAVGRDMKAYMKARSLRDVPVGYSAADVSSNRMQTAMYMNCGPDNIRSDFFAFNDYSWCTSNYIESGWDVKVKNFTDYGLPIFLSEYGCNTNKRNFKELESLMSTNMTGVYSGGIVYEYSMEDNKYGIVKIGDSKVEELDEFSSYSKALSSYAAPTDAAGAASTTHAVACPTKDATWEVDPAIIPDIPAKAATYMSKGAGTGQGLSTTGSQTNGDSGLSTSNSTDADKNGTSTSSSSSSSSSSSGDSNAGSQIITSGVAVSGVALMVTILSAILL
ncbi:1,3-beta-glucanosyltransferase [Ceratocystis pirilliformis]|uniref:1,3-beta-glucanosyltransferase n=1 Tax=Ceratocystis pirilliformis TaxID=259994 RepID=A0ABR3ZJT8_9PEZI